MSSEFKDGQVTEAKELLKLACKRIATVVLIKRNPRITRRMALVMEHGAYEALFKEVESWGNFREEET